MKKVRVSIQEIITTLSVDVVKVYGPVEGKFVDNLADPAHVTTTTLDWVKESNKKKALIIESSPALSIIVDKSIEYTNSVASQGKTLILVDSPRNAIAKVARQFFQERFVDEGIHPTAIIDPEAIIEEGVAIGAYTIIGKVHIGANTQINSGVKIYDGVNIGCNCFIDSGVVLGGQGFGYEIDENGNRFRFPQIGGLVIGNNVDIGANTCIDRGALSDTVIGDYTKIDNLCHIAHNNLIGSNCFITAGTIIAGSTEVGNNVWFGLNSTVKDWCSIKSNAMLGIGAVIIDNVNQGESVLGNPAMDSLQTLKEHVLKMKHKL